METYQSIHSANHLAGSDMKQTVVMRELVWELVVIKQKRPSLNVQDQSVELKLLN